MKFRGFLCRNYVIFLNQANSSFALLDGYFQSYIFTFVTFPTSSDYCKRYGVIVVSCSAAVHS